MSPKSKFNAAQKPIADPLKEAVINNDIESVQRFLKQGADVNQMNVINGGTLLMLASGQGHTKLALLLIDNGALLNIQSKSGYTALMLATAFNREEIVRLLVDKGADLDLTNPLGKTALEYAKNNHNARIIHLLEEAPEIQLRIAEANIRAAGAEKERLRHENVSTKQQWLREKARRRPGL